MRNGRIAHGVPVGGEETKALGLQGGADDEVLGHGIGRSIDANSLEPQEEVGAGRFHHPAFPVRGRDQSRLIWSVSSARAIQAATPGSLITMASIHSGDMLRPEAATRTVSLRPVTPKSRLAVGCRDRQSAMVSDRRAVKIAVHDCRAADHHLAASIAISRPGSGSARPFRACVARAD